MNNRKLYKRKISTIKKISKPLSKLLTQYTIEQYLKDNFEDTFVNEADNTGFKLLTDLTFKRSLRYTLCLPYVENNYVREDKKWSVADTIAFMHMVISISSIEMSKAEKDKREENIAHMFNIPKSKIRSTMLLFIRSMKEGDKKNLYEYFTDYEILNYVYYDVEKLNKDLEENKVADEDIKVLRKIYNI